MQATLKHLEYEGSIVFSEEDGMFHGRILGIRDVVSYGGKNTNSLKRNFHDVVDEYLAFCNAETKILEIKFNAVVQTALSEFLAHAE